MRRYVFSFDLNLDNEEDSQISELSLLKKVGPWYLIENCLILILHEGI